VTNPLDPFIDEIAKRVAKEVLLALQSAPTTTIAYTTSKGGPNPPGKTRAWALRMVKGMPGAHKVGRDWVISVVDYERWVQAMDSSRPRRRAERPTTEEEQLADRCLAEAGYRATKPAA
jgi:hypothetical protein